MKHEILGLKFEFAGLVLVLLVTIWQIVVTNWFETVPEKWQKRIDQEVNVAILESLSSISGQLTTTDIDTRQNFFKSLNETTYHAARRAEQEQWRLNKWVTGGQYKFVLMIKSVLFIFGALLFLIGILLIIKGKTSNKSLNSDCENDPATS